MVTSSNQTRTKERELSPAAQAAEAWLRQLARTLKVYRLYQRDNPIVVHAHDQMLSGIEALLEKHGQLNFRFSATEILLGEELVVKAGLAVGDEGVQYGALDELPFMFYRDGVRRVTILPSATRGELDAFFEALRLSAGASDSHDDLVTMLWQANLSQIMVESVPLEQTIYLSSRERGGPAAAAEAPKAGYTYEGGEMHADLGQAPGAQGLHVDTFDDWEAPESMVNVPAVYASMASTMDAAVARFRAMWEDEHATDWRQKAPDVLRLLMTLDPYEGMRQATSHAMATWVADALQRFAWEEARTALELLREFDPNLTRCGAELGVANERLDVPGIVERLDESEPDEAGRFAAVLASLGRNAVGLACAVLARTNNSRTRAAASTALCYICADEPRMLAPYLSDARPALVQNIAFVLGQIGGPEVADLLRAASQHPDARVRRQVVQALGNVPLDARLPLLLEQLDTEDSQLLGTALSMLTREKDERVARALLECMSASSFEGRSEKNRRALFGALGEVAGDEAVPMLEAQLTKGGWFARRSLERSAAARALERIGTQRSLAVLEAGLRSRSEAVRTACMDAMSQKGGTA
ncbi:MAG TPA: HEAT repeat domain-containing protein [Candidatus Eisenbacteria bacterium]